MVLGLFYLIKETRILTRFLFVLLNFDTMKKRVLVLFLCFLSFQAYFQPNMLRDSSIIVNISGNPIKFAWAGGLNFTNWGMLDLDLDGFKDLVVFDKSGGILRTFINVPLAELSAASARSGSRRDRGSRATGRFPTRRSDRGSRPRA